MKEEKPVWEKPEHYDIEKEYDPDLDDFDSCTPENGSSYNDPWYTETQPDPEDE